MLADWAAFGAVVDEVGVTVTASPDVGHGVLQGVGVLNIVRQRRRQRGETLASGETREWRKTTLDRKKGFLEPIRSISLRIVVQVEVWYR